MSVRRDRSENYATILILAPQSFISSALLENSRITFMTIPPKLDEQNG